MKKLLIASSVLAALTMGNVAHAGLETANGGTIEFIGEITDTTCLVDVTGTDTDADTVKKRTNNTVLLPIVKTTDLNGLVGRVAGRKQFQLSVHTENSTKCVVGNVANRDPDTGVPIAGVKPVSKVKAIFGGNLTTASKNQYGTSVASPVVTPGSSYAGEFLGNVNMTNGTLKNLLDANAPTSRDFNNTTFAASGVELQILDSDLHAIKVGDIASQETGNLYTGLSSSTTNSTLLTYYVQYISTNTTVGAGLVRGYVNYDLMYE